MPIAWLKSKSRYVVGSAGDLLHQNVHALHRRDRGRKFVGLLQHVVYSGLLGTSCFRAGGHFACWHAAVTGTSSVAHLEENVAAAEIVLSDDEFETLSAIGEQNA